MQENYFAAICRKSFRKIYQKENQQYNFLSVRLSALLVRRSLLSIRPVRLFGSCVFVRIRIESRSRGIVSDIVTVLLVTAIAIESEALAVSESSAEIGAEMNRSSTEPACYRRPAAASSLP